MITALGKKSKNLGALGSKFIDEHYVNAARNHDFMGMPEKANPDFAPIRRAFKDPAKFAVVESDEIKALRKRLQWVAAFRNYVETKDLLKQRELEQPVPRYVKFLAPRQPEIDQFHIDAKAERQRHNDWLAKERADMAQRRLAHALRA